VSDSDGQSTHGQLLDDAQLREAEVVVLARAMGLTLDTDELADVANMLSKYRWLTSALVGLELDEQSAVFADPFSQWKSISTS